jgi:hypothetical protein
MTEQEAKFHARFYMDKSKFVIVTDDGQIHLINNEEKAHAMLLETKGHLVKGEINISE